jgi:hypothetical protein
MYWYVILLAVGYLSMAIHEIGHGILVRMVGFNVLELHFGRPLIPGVISIANINIRFGFPFGGRCCYRWTKSDKSTPHRLAIVSMGGWLADLIVFFTLIKITSGWSETNTYMYLIWLYMVFKVSIGISPLTSDGRKVFSYLLSCLHYWHSS